MGLFDFLSKSKEDDDSTNNQLLKSLKKKIDIGKNDREISYKKLTQNLIKVLESLPKSQKTEAQDEIDFADKKSLIIRRTKNLHEFKKLMDKVFDLGYNEGCFLGPNSRHGKKLKLFYTQLDEFENNIMLIKLFHGFNCDNLGAGTLYVFQFEEDFGFILHYLESMLNS